MSALGAIRRGESFVINNQQVARISAERQLSLHVQAEVIALLRMPIWRQCRQQVQDSVRDQAKEHVRRET